MPAALDRTFYAWAHGLTEDGLKDALVDLCEDLDGVLRNNASGSLSAADVVAVLYSWKDGKRGALDDRADKLRAEIARIEGEDGFWVAVHALREGLWKLPVERRAQFDPLALISDPAELARHLTPAELQEAKDAGETDYWESVSPGELVVYYESAGRIAGLKHALAMLEGGDA